MSIAPFGGIRELFEWPLEDAPNVQLETKQRTFQEMKSPGRKAQRKKSRNEYKQTSCAEEKRAGSGGREDSGAVSQGQMGERASVRQVPCFVRTSVNSGGALFVVVGFLFVCFNVAQETKPGHSDTPGQHSSQEQLRFRKLHSKSCWEWMEE